MKNSSCRRYPRACVLEDDLEVAPKGGGHSGEREQWVQDMRELMALVKCRSSVLLGLTEGGVRRREQES